MPRQITPRPAGTPLPTVSLQHIDRISIEAGLDGSGEIAPSKVFLSFDVVEADSEGVIFARNRYTYPLVEWPAQIRTDIVTLRNHLLAAAETLGLIESGSDSGEIS
jgi:hypothetical protein